jgi:drug/metabolite transporter, DME family
MSSSEPAEHAKHAPSLTSARLLVLVAALLWSTSGFFAKAPFFDGWPGPVLAFWRAAFACLIIVPLVRRPVLSWKLLPMTATFAAMNYTYLTAMVKGSPANAIWLQNTAPAWVLLIGVLVFRERATFRDLLLVAFSAVGVGVILWFESRGASFEAVLWGLASGIFYAGIVLSLRQLRKFDSAWLAAANHSVTAAVLSVFGLAGLFDASSQSPWPAGIQWPLLIGFGVLQLGLPYVLFARALKSLPGHEAAGIGLAEPILVPVWALLAWGIKPDSWTLVGGGFILAGLVVRYAPLQAFRNGAQKVSHESDESNE